MKIFTSTASIAAWMSSIVFLFMLFFEWKFPLVYKDLGRQGDTMEIYECTLWFSNNKINRTKVLIGMLINLTKSKIGTAK